MTTYLNYTSANITNMTGALSYAATTFNTATGFNVFYQLMLMGFFIGALFVSNRYGFERSVLFASFFTLFIAVIFVIVGVVEPVWAILALVLVGLSYAAGM